MQYKQANSVVKREISGEIFLVPVKQKLADMQNLFVLHGCGDFIWGQLETPADKDVIAEKLAAEYDVSVDDALRDAGIFLQELVDAELVEASE